MFQHLARKISFLLLESMNHRTRCWKKNKFDSVMSFNVPKEPEQRKKTDTKKQQKSSKTYIYI